MHAGELETDTALVRRLLVAQFPQWAGLPLEPVASSGTENALYRLGDDMVVRLPRTDWAVGGLENAHGWLPRLAPLLPFEVPVPLALGIPAEGYPWPWSVYSWIEGENPTAGRVADSDSLAQDLVRFVGAMRRVELAGGPAAGRGGPLAERDEPTRRAIAELGGKVDAVAVTEAWEGALRTPVWSGPPVWVHNDLMPGNLLLRRRRLAGVIDFAGVGIGDPAADLIVAWNTLPAEARPGFRVALQVDDATWDRGRGLALSMALIALPYYEKTNPEFATIARYVIGEVLAERRS